MNDIVRPSALPTERTTPTSNEELVVDNGVTVARAKIVNVVNAGRPLASQGEAEGGSEATKAMTPLTTKQAIDVQVPVIVAAAINDLNLDTMSQEPASDYTKTSGLSAVALSNDYDDLDNLPTLGTAAATDATDYATAAQGAAADTAVQPGDLAAVATSGDYDDLSNKPTLGTMAAETASDYTKTSGLGGLALKDQVAIADIDAIGTADNTTYLRGDGTWSAAAGGSVDALFTEDLEKSPEEQAQARANISGQYALNIITPQMFGAVGDGVEDDTSALQMMLDTGNPVYWGDSTNVYRITGPLVVTANKLVKWQSGGATIKLDRATSIHRMVEINLGAHGAEMSGRLFIDANMKAFVGFWMANGGNAAKPDISVSGLSVKNVYRASQEFIGGDGIFIQGNFNSVIVRDVHVDGVVMATGAGVSGSYGVTGIAIIRDFANQTDARMVSLSDFTIRDVYCEDITYTVDQDGVRIFQSYGSAGVTARDGTAFVTKGRIENAHGRAIKVQTEHVGVSDILVVRNNRIYGAGYIGKRDIDLQTGGGFVDRIECQYSNNFPDRVVQITAPQVADRILPLMLRVSGLTIMTTGSGTAPPAIVDIDATLLGFSNKYLIDVSDIYVVGKAASDLISINHTVAAEFRINVVGMICTCTRGLVRIAGGGGGLLRVNAMGVCSYGTSVPVVTTSGAVTANGSLIGLNSNFTAV